MEHVLELQQELEERRSSRRSALLMGGAALAGLALSRKASAQSTAPSAANDANILNFELNLEYLEAQFYTYATTGQSLTAAGGSIAGGGGAAGGTVTIKSSSPKVPFTTDAVGTALMNYAMETAKEERNHVNFLQTALNANGANAAVAMPNINLQASFVALATAAGFPNPTAFDPFADQYSFLLGAFIFEDVGVTAYLGAAPSIFTPAYLSAALGIHAVEAYHAGSIRTQIFLASGAGATVGSVPLAAATEAVAATRAVLDGSSPADDIGVGTLTVQGSNGVGGLTASTIVDVSLASTSPSPGRVVPRTTSQVLSIVYGGGAAGTGGAFFPNGLNGAIR